MTTPTPAPAVPVLPEPSLTVAETFGMTVQGEGPSLGRRCYFVRLGGCSLACQWCTVPGTLILRPDFTWTPVEDLQPGDVVLGRTAPDKGKHGILVESTVLHTARRQAPLVKVNGGLTCSADTRAWVSHNRNAHSGWREFTRTEGLNCTFMANPAKRDQEEYERGYVAGMADGDGCFWTLRAQSQRNTYRRFRLALNDQNLLDRTREYAERAGFTLRPGSHQRTGFKGSGTMSCLWLTNSREAERFEAWVEEDVDSESWAWGYLGGIFDSEGSLNPPAVLRIAQYRHIRDGERVYQRAMAAAERLGFDVAQEASGIRIRARGGELWRFLTGATPAKAHSLAAAIGRAPNNIQTVHSVEDVGEGEVVSLTTSTGNYFAEGWLVHNCDSKFTWDASRYNLREELTRRTVSSIVQELEEQEDLPLLVITGGEPLLHQQQRGWEALLRWTWENGVDVEVETSGTIVPTEVTSRYVTAFNVSPKLSNSGMEPGRRIVPAALAALVGRGARFKFVCRTPADLEEIQELAAAHHIPASSIWVMGEGTTRQDVTRHLQAVAEAAIGLGYNLTDRLHVTIWGDERGR